MQRCIGGSRGRGSTGSVVGDLTCHGLHVQPSNLEILCGFATGGRELIPAELGRIVKGLGSAM